MAFTPSACCLKNLLLLPLLIIRLYRARSSSMRNDRTVRLVSVAAFVLCFAQRNDAFSVKWRQNHRPSSSLYSFDKDAAARAGASGYSVLRQPVQWDPTQDPTFDAPTTLTDTENDIRDETWLTERTTTATTRRKRPQSEPDTRKTSLQDPAAELDLFQRTLDTLDYPTVLDALRFECSTVPGRRMVTEAAKTRPFETKKTNIPKEFRPVYEPLTATSLEGVQERYGAVREMQRIEEGLYTDDACYRNRKGYKMPLGPPPLAGISFDLDLLLQPNQVLEGPELLDIVTMLDVLEDVSLWSEGLKKYSADFVELPKLAGCIQINATLQELLHNAFDKEGRLSGTTFPSIGRLRAKVRTLKGDILNTLETLLSTPSISSKLALESGGPRYSEVNGRIVIPIDDKYGKASLGIIHDASRSGKTLFVEPTEIVQPTNELRQAEAELRTEEARVWRSLTEQVMQNRAALEGSVNAAGQLDLVMARVALGKKLAGVIPQVGNEGIISLRNAKHPVLLFEKLIMWWGATSI